MRVTTGKKRLGALVTAIAALSLVVAGCSDAGDGAADEASGKDTQAAETDPGETGYDLSKVETDPEIAKLVPEDVKKSGFLINGASTDYAPGEYRKSDGTTPTGYDIDMVKALAKVMGLEGQTKHIPFDGLIPRIGDEVNIGASSFTITEERMKEKNMISYFRAGFQFATAKGNPNDFDMNNLCGTTIGVQTGTAQQDWLNEENDKCTDAGKEAINIMPSGQQTEIGPKVASGQYDATVADSPVAGYYVRKMNGQLELHGDVFDSALHGIAVDKNDQQLTEVVQKALQKLMDDGTLKDILTHYGVENGFESEAQLNPAVEE